MNKQKCTNCGVINLATDLACRRCGNNMDKFMTSSSRLGPREEAKKGSWLSTLIFLAIIAGGTYYLFSGVEKSYDDIKAGESKRLASAPTEGLSTRSQFEQQQKQNYKTAVSNSQGLSESQKHNEDVKQLMK